MSGRKSRSDSTSAKVQAVKSAQIKIEPPQKLTKQERRYWESIVTSRDSWTPIDLERAVKLARLYVEIDEYEKELSKTKRWFTSDSGLPKLHPLHVVVKDLWASEIQMCRSLQIHSRATNGESRDQVNKNKLFQEARASIQEDDGLIARIN
ncbi:hypothetical protein [Pasteurella sp. PK-2025]|uniref:hypothetical protein n=1 Tax=unclassified Pasteurella TaxID=2621516 RepID=UPI003C73E9FD